MIRRREFIAGLGAAAWPVVARAQQAAVPVVGFVNSGSADTSAGFVAAFRKGLGETGYVDGQNVIVEYHWLEGQYERLPDIMAELVRRHVAVITTWGDPTAPRGQGCDCDNPDRVRRCSRPGQAWPCR